MNIVRILTLAVPVLGLSYGVFFLACTPQKNVREAIRDLATPHSAIAPISDALTFARTTRDDGAVTLLLVVDQIGSDVMGIDLGPELGRIDADPFQAIGSLGHERLTALASEGQAKLYPIARLLPVVKESRNIAFGTNFAAHGEEVGNEQPYVFPKYSAPTAPVSQIAQPQRGLLDYEVELCMVFDRHIRHEEDFDLASKAVFLCGDFTDRDRLVRRLPPDEPQLSGIGFTDAKSAPGYFPTGPFLVVPNDWQSFVSGEVIATELNGDVMQYSSGAEMILDFREMTGFALREGREARWRFEGAAVPLVEGDVIRKGVVLMSGTPSGILFRPPTDNEIACGSVAFVCLAGFMSGDAPRAFVVDRFLTRLQKSGVFLQQGDVVLHRSSHLGEITAKIVAPQDEHETAEE